MFNMLPTGEPLTRRLINDIPRYVLSMIRPGPGIRIFPSGDGGVCISADEVRRSGGGVGGGGGGARGAAFVSLNTDGNTMEVYLWEGTGWATSTTTVYKPYILRYSYWNGATITYADGTSRTYDATALDKAYQRRSTWTGGNTEVQEITSPYGVGEPLDIVTDMDGNMMDDNNAGRHWAATA